MKKNKIKIENLKVKSFVTSISKTSTNTVNAGRAPIEPHSLFGQAQFCRPESCPSDGFVTAYNGANGCNTEESVQNCSEF